MSPLDYDLGTARLPRALGTARHTVFTNKEGLGECCKPE